MGSGGSKKRSVSVSAVNHEVKHSSFYSRSKSVPSNLGVSKERSVTNNQNGYAIGDTEVKMDSSLYLKTSQASINEKQVANVSPPERTDIDGCKVVSDSVWTVTELYNILIAESWLGKPQLHNPLYLLLLDCRPKDIYQSSHVLTAKHHSSLYSEYGCLLDVRGQLEAYDIILIYNDGDGTTANALQSKNISFCTLNSSFSGFQRKYPFLCTSELISSVEQRTKQIKSWPSEILDSQLYQSAASHVADAEIISELGITHILNITLDKPNSFPKKVTYMTIRLADQSEIDLSSWIPKTTKFISNALESSSDSRKSRVLVHCNLGRSRSSTIVIGYLMEAKKWSLKDACDWLKDCRPTVQPNLGFLQQLVDYEQKVFGRKLSDYNSLPF